jgi:hypothetical protein
MMGPWARAVNRPGSAWLLARRGRLRGHTSPSIRPRRPLTGGRPARLRRSDAVVEAAGASPERDWWCACGTATGDLGRQPEMTQDPLNHAPLFDQRDQEPSPAARARQHVIAEAPGHQLRPEQVRRAAWRRRRSHGRLRSWPSGPFRTAGRTRASVAGGLIRGLGVERGEPLQKLERSNTRWVVPSLQRCRSSRSTWPVPVRWIRSSATGGRRA